MNIPALTEDNIATIAASFATRQDVTIDDIVTLVARLHGDAGAAVEKPSQAMPARSVTTPLVPVLPLHQAVTRSQVFCLCCGRGFKMLKRHLGAEHGMTEAEYREAFDLPDSMPLVAPDYSEKKAAYARQAGLGTHARDTAEREKGVS